MMFANGETVTVLTAGTETDPYSNDPVEDWDNPTPVDVPGCAIEPRPSTEPLADARNAVVSGYTVYMPTGTVVGPQNRMMVRGDTYPVLGEPAVWVNPFTGWAPGIVVQVGRTSG